MSNTIKFTVRVVDAKNRPCSSLSINCKSGEDLDHTDDFQFYYKKLDDMGECEFEFQTNDHIVDVMIEVHGDHFDHSFKNGDTVTFKLLPDDDLNMFLEIMAIENKYADVEV